MFRNLIYKIIAVVGLLASMLGPQVASGAEFPGQSVQPNSHVSVETIPVVSSQNSNIDIAVDGAPNCDNKFTWRLDLLLWQSCNVTIKTSVLDVNPKVVVSELAGKDTKVSITAGPKLTNKSQLNTSSDRSIDIVFSNTLTALSKQEKILHGNVFIERSSIVISLQNFSNDSLNVVMRC